MSAIAVDARELWNCFSALALTVPKGDSEVPVHLTISDSILRIRCLSGCAFEGAIQVNSNDVEDKVIMWYDATAILPKTDNVLIEFSNNYVKVIGKDAECTFATGYSDIVDFDLSGYNYLRVQSKGYEEGFRNLQSLNFEKLYNKSAPILIYQDIAVLKYPCTYVQVRTTGFPFTMALDPNHTKLITRFKPDEAGMDKDSGSLLLKRGNTMIQVPCKLDIESNDFSSYMKDMKVICRTSLEGFSEKFTNASKVAKRTDCRVILYSAGMKIEISMGVASSTIGVGDLQGEVVKAFTFPMQTLQAFFKTIGDNLAEILVGGELLCLRTQTIIILTRVLY